MSHILRFDAEDKPEIGEPIVVDLLRFEPSSDPEPQFHRYIVPYRQRMSVLTLLREIYEHQDPTIAFRNQQCGRGICGTCHCRVEINGQKQKLVKGCNTPLNPGDRLIVYPSNLEKSIRDLVTTF
jgi:succinate dehydrogenase/fumarate reductase-like Fe-S protein